MRRAALVALVLVVAVAITGCKKKNGTSAYDIMGPSAQLAPAPDQGELL